MKTFVANLLWTIFAIFTGLSITVVILTIQNPVKFDEIGDTIFFNLVEAVTVGIPYGVLWYSLSIRHECVIEDYLYQQL